jgi:ankyrin repeat protein
LWAARQGHTEIVRKLLKHGADVNVVANGGWTALHLAADNVAHAKQAKQEIVAILLEAGARLQQSQMEDRPYTWP